MNGHENALGLKLGPDSEHSQALHIPRGAMHSDPNSDAALWARQEELEREMAGQGADRIDKLFQKARSKLSESSTKMSLRLIREGVEPLANKIRESLKATRKRIQNRGGAEPISFKYLQKVKPEVAAYITFKVILDTISGVSRVQRAAIQIGSMIEDDLRYKSALKGSHRRLINEILDDINSRSPDYNYKRKVLNHTLRKKEVPWDPWPDLDKFHLGSKLIDLLVQATGLVRLELVPRGRKTELHIVPEEKTEAWIQASLSSLKSLSPVYLPMVVPPIEWNDPAPKQACYYTEMRKPLTLVKTRYRAYLEELRNSDLSKVYAAINAVQNTAWRVNKNILMVLHEAWQSNAVLGGLPNQENEPLPPKPIDIAENRESRRKWKKQALVIYKERVKARSKRFQITRIIQVARMFENDDAIYFPHQLDFRGRIYAVPMFLNPQGPDVAKALLTFADGKALGTQEAADWLAIHGANTWGQDKVSFKQRVDWVLANEANIKASAENPLDHTWWTQASKPWQFLAFCFEWYGYRQHGLEYISSLPIALDGSCNGLQHFSAMLRDEVGGAAVNLIPSEKPQDIYQVVADRVTEKLKLSPDTWASIWLSFGVNRKVTKRPVMVTPYGGTIYSCRDYIQDSVVERLREGEKNLFGDKDQLFDACAFLARLVMDSISEIVVSARSAMDWLQDVVRTVYSDVRNLELPIVWKSPSGFAVQQYYLSTSQHEAKTVIAGKTVWVALDRDTDVINRMRQANGISPNFVHSMDAAALVLCVNKCLGAGINSYAMIHDSYGTVAADTSRLAVLLREAFIDTYQTDVLQEFKKAAELLEDTTPIPDPPPKGNLDLSLVKQSQFFFA